MSIWAYYMFRYTPRHILQPPPDMKQIDYFSYVHIRTIICIYPVRVPIHAIGFREEIY